MKENTSLVAKMNVRGPEHAHYRVLEMMWNLVYPNVDALYADLGAGLCEAVRAFYRTSAAATFDSTISPRYCSIRAARDAARAEDSISDKQPDDLHAGLVRHALQEGACSTLHRHRWWVVAGQLLLHLDRLGGYDRVAELFNAMPVTAVSWRDRHGTRAVEPRFLPRQTVVLGS